MNKNLSGSKKASAKDTDPAKGKGRVSPRFTRPQGLAPQRQRRAAAQQQGQQGERGFTERGDGRGGAGGHGGVGLQVPVVADLKQ